MRAAVNPCRQEDAPTGEPSLGRNVRQNTRLFRHPRGTNSTNCSILSPRLPFLFLTPPPDLLPSLTPYCSIWSTRWWPSAQVFFPLETLFLLRYNSAVFSNHCDPPPPVISFSLYSDIVACHVLAFLGLELRVTPAPFFPLSISAAEASPGCPSCMHYFTPFLPKTTIFFSCTPAQLN